MGTEQITGPINLHDEAGCVTALQLKLRYTAPDDTKSSINCNLTKRLIKKKNFIHRQPFANVMIKRPKYQCLGGLLGCIYTELPKQ